MEGVIALMLSAANAAGSMVDVKQDFWEFVGGLWTQELWVSSWAMIAGAFAHWIKKAAFKEASWNLWVYCFRDYPWRSVSLVFALIAGEVTFITSPLNDGLTWSQLIVTCFLAGFTINSTVNKGRPPDKREDGNVQDPARGS